jgi:hypothetical protein
MTLLPLPLPPPLLLLLLCHCCSLSGFNSGGSGTAGTGIGNFRRATSRGPFRTSAGCILEGSGNKAVTSCMTAGKRRLLHA